MSLKEDVLKMASSGRHISEISQAVGNITNPYLWLKDINVHQPAQVVCNEHEANISTGSLYSFFNDDIIKAPLPFYDIAKPTI